MTEEQLRSMTEQQIRARFRCAPAYYLEAKLDSKRALESAGIALPEPWSLDILLPGFEILDAALAEPDSLDTPSAQQPAPDPRADPEPGLPLPAILEAALEGNSSWPLLSDPESEPEPEPAAESELERKLNLLLESEPELDLLPESEPKGKPNPVPDNVTQGDFEHRAPRTVRIVSVVMDRKRPNMVRVVGETTRLAS